MDNKFAIAYNPFDGTVESLVHTADADAMNWVQGSQGWGTVRDSGKTRLKVKDLHPAHAQMSEYTAIPGGIKVVYNTYNLKITVTRQIVEDKYVESYTFKNILPTDVFFGKGALGIYTTFNDSYENSRICMTNRCHTHIWCGNNSTYIKAIKMGTYSHGLGLVLTKGSIDSYSVERIQDTPDRGDFILHPSPFNLMPGEEYTLEWELFWFEEGIFEELLGQYDNIVRINAEEYTVFNNEKIRFSVSKSDAGVYLDGERVPVSSNDGKTYVCFEPRRLGEHEFEIRYGDYTTYARFFVQIPFEELVKKRVEFIVNHQQFNRPGSSLDGAYMIYDNQDKCIIFDDENPDFNACRERLVMGLLVAKYLQMRPAEKIYRSLMRYYDFVVREFYDEETGTVYNTIGKNPAFKRLYNAPWMSIFMMEMYNLTGDKKYLLNMVKLLKVYYSIGGDKFYPNGLSMYESVDALHRAGMAKEADEITALYKKHAENIINTGVFYPAHEAPYEQTIVTPAVTLLSQVYMIENDERILNECKGHLKILEKFNGRQPDFHMYENSIRHWDAFYFGKRKNFGDTFPHAAAIHTANSYLHYAHISGDKDYLKRAVTCARNMLCLYTPKGEGTMAYVYPLYVNDVRCGYYDEFSNEQDGVMYYLIKYYGFLGGEALC